MKSSIASSNSVKYQSKEIPTSQFVRHPELDSTRFFKDRYIYEEIDFLIDNMFGDNFESYSDGETSPSRGFCWDGVGVSRIVDLEDFIFDDFDSYPNGLTEPNGGVNWDGTAVLIST